MCCRIFGNSVSLDSHISTIQISFIWLQASQTWLNALQEVKDIVTMLYLFYTFTFLDFHRFFQKVTILDMLIVWIIWHGGGKYRPLAVLSLYLNAYCLPEKSFVFTLNVTNLCKCNLVHIPLTEMVTAVTRRKSIWMTITISHVNDPVCPR
jgi:hypothetical protein